MEAASPDLEKQGFLAVVFKSGIQRTARPVGTRPRFDKLSMTKKIPQVSLRHSVY
jgi:hypothetical protein